MICKICQQEFAPARPLQAVCSLSCAKKVPRHQRKQKIAQDRARKEAIKPRSKWLQEAQSVVNRYVRLRDAHKPCASCDRPASWGGQWHASHLRSVGAASAIRFHLWNIHKACSICNNWKSGNLSEYEPRLRELIGDAKVDWLRSQNHRAEYSVDYLKRIKAVFTKKANRKEANAVQS
jgi:hypothetical protein